MNHGFQNAAIYLKKYITLFKETCKISEHFKKLPKMGILSYFKKTVELSSNKRILLRKDLCKEDKISSS
jgi:hypothetical protein